MDYMQFKIGTLCQYCDSSCHFVCFDKAAPLMSFAQRFYILSKEQSSGLFHIMWSHAMKEARAKFPKMHIKDVEEMVWTPAFEHCQQLLNTLCDLSMTLANVDKHFRYYEKSELENQLRLLCCGVNKCFGQVPKFSDNWIPRVVLRIEDYRKLSYYRDAANSFLKLRDSLNLTKGDFRDIEGISKEVMIQHYNCILF